MRNINESLFDWCKDHHKTFGVFPLEYATFNEDGSEQEVIRFPEYLKYLTDSQIRLIEYHQGEEK